MKSEGKGHIFINCNNGNGNFNKVLVTNVLYVPNGKVYSVKRDDSRWINEAFSRIKIQAISRSNKSSLRGNVKSIIRERILLMWWWL